MESPAFSVCFSSRGLFSSSTISRTVRCSLQNKSLSRRQVLTNVGRIAVLLLVGEASARGLNAEGVEKMRETSSGLEIIEVARGSGPTPKKGQLAKVHYTLTLGDFDGKVIDSSRERKKPFRFNVGIGQVIRGWDEALLAMNVGSRWKLIIPPKLGYGERGAGSVIPPNSTLYFDVELLGLDH